MVKVNSKVALNPRDVAAVSDTARLDHEVLLKATDLSGGARRTAVFMNSGAVFLIELKVETFLHRLEQNGPKAKK